MAGGSASRGRDLRVNTPPERVLPQTVTTRRELATHISRRNGPPNLGSSEKVRSYCHFPPASINPIDGEPEGHNRCLWLNWGGKYRIALQIGPFRANPPNAARRAVINDVNGDPSDALVGRLAGGEPDAAAVRARSGRLLWAGTVGQSARSSMMSMGGSVGPTSSPGPHGSRESPRAPADRTHWLSGVCLTQKASLHLSMR